MKRTGDDSDGLFGSNAKSSKLSRLLSPNSSVSSQLRDKLIADVTSLSLAASLVFSSTLSSLLICKTLGAGEPIGIGEGEVELQSTFKLSENEQVLVLLPIARGLSLIPWSSSDTDELRQLLVLFGLILLNATSSEDVSRPFKLLFLV